MSAKKTRKRKSPFKDDASRFIKCPSCHKSFSQVSINHHLETCIKTLSNEQTKDEVTPQRNCIIEDKVSPQERSPIQANNNNEEEPRKVPTRNPDENQSHNNALQHLMNNSKQYYSAKVKRQQWFHLSTEGKIAWIRDGPDCFAAVNHLDIKWSTTVLIHASRQDESKDRDIELHVSSAIEPETKYRQLVAQKSRLSVPVLKSILQKGIRRRRPLPSVRVAMELADKSFGDLIRRLPIICLEDSFLHHEFPFLIWLMVAHSKEYIPTQKLVIRLFRIVFEIASCPWKDECVEPEESHDQADDDNFSLTLSSDLLHADPECDLMLRAMLMRKKYGGMACDLKMMDTFVRLWSHRYTKQKVDPNLLVACETKCDGISWQVLPQFLHPVDKSLLVVTLLVQEGVRCLKKHDICLAGIDFHCSNILDVILKNQQLQIDVNKLYDRHHSLGELASLLKKACWNCSGGVNFRRFWKMGAPPCTKDVDDKKIKQIWELATPHANQFVSGYLQGKLVN